MSEEVTDVEIMDSGGDINLPAMQTESFTIDKFKADIELQKQMFEVLKDFVRNQLVPGVDYYSVKKGAKPSLGQPGAEKINYLFHLIPKPIMEEKVFTSQEVRYEYIVELYNKNTQKFAGSGVGCCSSMEDKYRYYWDKNSIRHEIDNHINVANTIKKMAYKRAYVDACVKNTMASFLFTQDLEDLPDYYIGKDSDNFGKKKITNTPHNGPTTTTPQQQSTFDWSKLDLTKIASPKMIKRLFAIQKKLLITDNEFKLATTDITKKEHSKEWNYGDVKAIDEWLADYEKESPTPEEQAGIDNIQLDIDGES